MRPPLIVEVGDRGKPTVTIMSTEGRTWVLARREWVVIGSPEHADGSGTDWQWFEVTEAPGLGGRVLTYSEAADLLRRIPPPEVTR